MSPMCNMSACHSFKMPFVRLSNQPHHQSESTEVQISQWFRGDGVLQVDVHPTVQFDVLFAKGYLPHIKKQRNK